MNVAAAVAVREPRDREPEGHIEEGERDACQNPMPESDNCSSRRIGSSTVEMTKRSAMLSVYARHIMRRTYQRTTAELVVAGAPCSCRGGASAVTLDSNLLTSRASLRRSRPILVLRAPSQTSRMSCR